MHSSELRIHPKYMENMAIEKPMSGDFQKCMYCQFLRCVGNALNCQLLYFHCPSSQNIQSTNWQSFRFKRPPPNSSIGWRVEFRPMEVMLTDFENAAYVVFIVLLTRAILSFKLNGCNGLGDITMM